MPKLFEAKKAQQVKKKVPQFSQIRKRMHSAKTPEVTMKLAYKKKDTGEVVVIEDTKTPKSRFPPHLYEKMYEVATAKVNILLSLFYFIFILKLGVIQILNLETLLLLQSGDCLTLPFF